MQLLEPIQSMRHFRIESTMLQCLLIHAPYPIIRKQVMAILMGRKALNTERTQHSTWHTPRDLIAGIDINALEIRMCQCFNIMICHNCHLQWPTIALCGCLTDIGDIGLIRFRREELLIGDFALLLHNPLPDLLVRSSHTPYLPSRSCAERTRKHIREQALQFFR